MSRELKDGKISCHFQMKTKRYQSSAPSKSIWLFVGRRLASTVFTGTIRTKRIIEVTVSTVNRRAQDGGSESQKFDVALRKLGLTRVRSSESLPSENLRRDLMLWGSLRTYIDSGGNFLRINIYCAVYTICPN
jgi:hypothetical protein